MSLYLSNKKKLIQINLIPLGEGGEGKVYEVISPLDLQSYVVKIYHLAERNPQKEAKLQYLKEHRPQLQNNFSVIWVEDLVYENGVFVGFLMPKAISGVDLTYLTGLQISEKLPTEWHQKYSRQTIQGFENRAKLCYNIASAVSQIHQSGHYVLVDLKPENLKIKLNGQVSLLDIDSTQVIENEQIIFPAPKLSPEYSPQEIKQLSLTKDYIPETWDRFSLAVVFYKVLFGLHPFAVTGKNEYQKLDSHEQKIQAGLFPYGQKSTDIQVVPPPHANFEALSFDIKDLFIRAFDNGFHAPEKRPNASEWCEKLLDFQPIAGNYKSPVKKVNKSNVPESDSRPLEFHETKIFQNFVRAILLLILISPFILSIFVERSSEKQVKNRIEILQEEEEATKSIKSSEKDNTTNLQTLNKNLKELSEKSIHKHGNFRDGYARVIMLDKDRNIWLFGLIDELGKLVIQPQYEDLKFYINEIITAKLNGKYGYINLNDEVLIPFQFDEASNFKFNNKAKVKQNGKEFYINKTGECIEFCP